MTVMSDIFHLFIHSFSYSDCFIYLKAGIFHVCLLKIICSCKFYAPALAWVTQGWAILYHSLFLINIFWTAHSSRNCQHSQLGYVCLLSTQLLFWAFSSSFLQPGNSNSDSKWHFIPHHSFPVSFLIQKKKKLNNHGTCWILFRTFG